MEYKYFNEAEGNYALKPLSENPYEAERRLEEYLKKYPRDLFIKAFYVIVLITLGKFDEAETVYDDVIRDAQKFNYASLGPRKLSGLKYNILHAKMKLLAHKGLYKDLLELIQNEGNILNPYHYNYIYNYCQSKLGLLTKNDIYNKKAYRLNQIVDYSEEVFREHVKKHEADFNIGLEEQNGAVFTADFPIDKIIDEIKKYIPSKKRISPGYFEDTYFFRYDGCGRINDSPTNYFYVDCFSNTTNFITMCPISDARYYQYEDLNYLKKYDEDKDNDQRPSQIDKFNRRYNRS